MGGVQRVALFALLLLHAFLPSTLLQPSWLLSQTLRASKARDDTNGGSSKDSSSADGISFNVILTTTGRPELARMLASVGPQLRAVDHLTVISDAPPSDTAARGTGGRVALMLAAAWCHNCTKRFIENEQPLGGHGHNSRARWQNELPGAFHMHGDDDDVYTPDAFDIIRACITSLAPRVYVFRILKLNVFRDGNLPVYYTMPALEDTDPRQVVMGNVGTPSGVYRALPELVPRWKNEYGGDGMFYEELLRNFGYENVVMVPRVIYTIAQDFHSYLHVFGIDQPRGVFFVDADGRPLPDGPVNQSAPFLNGVPLHPNPLLSLPDRSTYSTPPP